MKKIDSFTNLYPVNKTLRFGLEPVGKTKENFDNNQILLQDDKKSEAYTRVKGYIDRYHKYYIDKILSRVVLDDIDEYAELYYKQTKTESDKKAFKAVADKIRKQISDAFTKSSDYKSLWNVDMIKTILPDFLTDEAERNDVIENFTDFFTYFEGFNKNRKNMYSSEEKSTAIAYRCVNDNLPKFLDNAKTYEKYKALFNEAWFDELDEAFNLICGTKSRDIFSVDYFSFVTTQNGIDQYNGIIGGYTMSDGTKIQGLNEKINLYNQTASKENRIPKFKMLFKQILSDKESVSYIPEKFKDDDDALQKINIYFSEKLDTSKIAVIFEKFDTYDESKIYVSAGSPVTNISKKIFSDWGAIERVWNNNYDEVKLKKPPKDYEKYSETRKKAYKANKSFSISELQLLCNQVTSDDVSYDGSVKNYYRTEALKLIDAISQYHSEANSLLTTPYTDKKRLSANDAAVIKIKNLLDSVKELENLLKSLFGTGEESDKDEMFYGEFSEAYSSLKDMNKLYDRVRNHITQKPYSNDKIKLNFGNPQFLAGWAKNLELARSAQLFKLSDSEYYLAVIDKNAKRHLDY